LAEQTGHYIQFDQPEWGIEAINQVLEADRARDLIQWLPGAVFRALIFPLDKEGVRVYAGLIVKPARQLGCAMPNLLSPGTQVDTPK
jgi:hypothetical protein